MRIKIREAVQSDIEPVFDNLRQEDKDELIFFHGNNYRSILEHSVDESLISWVLESDKVFAIGGLNPEDTMGIVWMLSTDEVTKYPVQVYKHMLSCFMAANRFYKKVGNIILKKNHVSIKLLKNCGCRFNSIDDNLLVFWREQDV